MALELREVEVGSSATIEEAPAVVEQVEAEVEEAPGHGGAVDPEVLLHEMPAARPDEEGRDLVLQAIGAAVRVDELDGPVDGVHEVGLPLDHVRPGRGVGVLEVGHEDVGPRVEGIDDHLPLGRPRDLDPATLEVPGNGRDRPPRLADGAGLGEEVGAGAAVERGLTRGARLEQGGPRRAELPLEPRHELERGRCQDGRAPTRDRGANLDIVPLLPSAFGHRGSLRLTHLGGGSRITHGQIGHGPTSHGADRPADRQPARRSGPPPGAPSPGLDSS